jgi:hypothetical protein
MAVVWTPDMGDIPWIGTPYDDWRADMEAAKRRQILAKDLPDE